MPVTLTRGPPGAAVSHSQSCLDEALDIPPHVSYVAVMAARAGRQRTGTDCGRLVLRTCREGPAARAGHDLAAGRGPAGLPGQPDTSHT